MNKYTIDKYINDIDKYGLKRTWHTILSKSLNNTLNSDVFNVNNYGELYEIGLEHVNKISKKEMGKYYTPRDVSDVMSKWLKPLKGDNICDVGCGTGNLILSYLDNLNRKDALKVIGSGNIYLYDLDDIALEICKYSIAIKYGKKYLKKIHTNHCDFLDKTIKLPKNSKVISNPPYYRIVEEGKNWNITEVISDSRELYSAFIEKIINQSDSSVIITPYSFIGSDKFYSLRKVMNDYNGFVVSFDNVPGNIFNGRKHGIFNSNKGNSVRAAITVVENVKDLKGFRFSPLIRFKTEERKRVLDNHFLYSLINNRYQVVDSNHRAYYKCHSDLLNILDTWKEKSNKTMSDLIEKDNGYELYLPTTCRYFTVGSKRNLLRDGKRIIKVNNKNTYNYVYCMLNSTFTYWYWRLYDGGINCPLTIINAIPVFLDLFNDKQLSIMNDLAEEMQRKEKEYLVYKVNAGKKQENIKFPKKYRNEINRLFFDVLGIDENINILNKIHSSSLFEESESEGNE